MKPAKGTIQWLAPHLSDGEVQAIYEAMLGVIGEDEHFPKDDPRFMFEGEPFAWPHRNELRAEQRAALNRLFGKETE